MEILLSIKPKYSKKIFSGKKRYEFRKKKPRRFIKRIFIYETHPSKSIVGWFSVKKIHSGSPEEIWEKCKDSSGIDRKSFFSYCKGTKIIHALEINETFRFDNPIDPCETIPGFKPPQSFKYLERESAPSSLISNIDLF